MTGNDVEECDKQMERNMRNLVIMKIRNSQTWVAAIKAQKELGVNCLPVLEDNPDAFLLELYKNIVEYEANEANEDKE